DEAIRAFLRQPAGRPSNRKPMAGFNPEIYSAEALTAEQRGTINPFADFIEKGMPAGRWRSSMILPSQAAPGPSRLRIALQVHAFYPDLVDEFLTCMAANRSRCDLFISTPNQAAATSLRGALRAYDNGLARISIVPNRGRDLGPFLTQYNFVDGQYDLV